MGNSTARNSFRKSRNFLKQKENVEALVSVVENGSEKERELALENLHLISVIAPEKYKIMISDLALTPSIEKMMHGNDSERESATAIICNLSIVPKLRHNIQESGGTRAAVRLVQTGNDIQREKAAFVLYQLSDELSYLRTIVSYNGLDALVDMIENCTIRGKSDAAKVMLHISQHVEFKDAVAKAGGFQAMIDYYIYLAREGSHREKELAAESLSCMTEDVGCRLMVFHSNGLKPLIDIAKAGSNEAKNYALDALYHLSLSSEIKQQMKDYGGVEILVDLVGNGSTTQRNKAKGSLLQLTNEFDGSSSTLGSYLKRESVSADSNFCETEVEMANVSNRIEKIPRDDHGRLLLDGLDAQDCFETEVGSLLKGSRLEKYAIDFYRHGYETKAQISSIMTDDDLRNVFGVRFATDRNVLKKIFRIKDKQAPVDSCPLLGI